MNNAGYKHVLNIRNIKQYVNTLPEIRVTMGFGENVMSKNANI